MKCVQTPRSTVTCYSNGRGGIRWGGLSFGSCLVPKGCPTPHQHQHQQLVGRHWGDDCLVQQPRIAAAPQAVLAAVTMLSLLGSSPAIAATADVNFGTKCLGCHVNGGNIIHAGATLFEQDLVKNGVADSDNLYKLIYSGKGRMPGFGTECAPKVQCTFGPRLSDEEVQDLVAYVQEQAAAGWKQQ